MLIEKEVEKKKYLFLVILEAIKYPEGGSATLQRVFIRTSMIPRMKEGVEMIEDLPQGRNEEKKKKNQRKKRVMIVMRIIIVMIAVMMMKEMRVETVRGMMMGRKPDQLTGLVWYTNSCHVTSSILPVTYIYMISQYITSYDTA